jgi:DNA-binding beta-propeller fold protein YncE
MKQRMNRTSTTAAALGAIVACSVLLGVPLVAASQSSSSLAATVVSHPPTATTCAVGSGPGYPGYDPVSHDIYVPNELSGNISVLSATCHRVGSVSLPSGAEPISAAFDPQDNEMYVTDDSLDQVYAISGLVVKTTITSTLFGGPREIIWDPGDSMLLLTNDFGSYSVIGIQGNAVQGEIGVGSYPQGICYDPYENTVLVVNYMSANVSVLGAFLPLGTPVTTFAVGFDPQQCVFDVADNHDYITNLGDDNLSVVYGNGAPVGSVAVGDLPTSIGWDQATLQVFVVDSLHGGISIVQGLSVVSTLHPGVKGGEGMAYDAGNNALYIASFSTDSVFVEP